MEQQYLGGPIALVVFPVCPAAGLVDEIEDGATEDLPRLELKGFDGAVNSLDAVDAVVEILEVFLIGGADRFGGLLA